MFSEGKLGEGNLDLSKAVFTLDMYCLTLPAPYPADLPISESGQNIETIATTHNDSQTSTSNEQQYVYVYI